MEEIASTKLVYASILLKSSHFIHSRPFETRKTGVTSSRVFLKRSPCDDGDTTDGFLCSSFLPETLLRRVPSMNPVLVIIFLVLSCAAMMRGAPTNTTEICRKATNNFCHDLRCSTMCLTQHKCLLGTCNFENDKCCCQFCSNSTAVAE